MTDLQTFEIYLKDEIPKFHTGLRKITVTQIGPTWVRLQCGRKKARIRRSLWVELIRSSVNNPRR